MIQLSDTEREWLHMIKLHRKVPGITWADKCCFMYREIYGDNGYSRWEQAVFNSLLTLYFKIRIDGSGDNVDIKDVFHAAFYPSYIRQEKEPIDRAIAELCGQIQGVVVIENGVKRFEL